VSHFISQAYRVVIINELLQPPQRPQFFVSKNRHRLSIFPLDPSFPWGPLDLCQASPDPQGVSPQKPKLGFLFCQVELFFCRHWQRERSCWHSQWTVHVLV